MQVGVADIVTITDDVDKLKKKTTSKSKTKSSKRVRDGADANKSIEASDTPARDHAAIRD